MPTTITIEFPWGRYHGTPWGRNVNEGVVDWPPEPWRLLRALYATWRARAAELPTEVVVPLLDALAEPPEYLVPPFRISHTRHFYPDAKHGPNGAAKDKDKVFDTFAVMKRNAKLVVTWPLDLDDSHRHALGVLCERLTYLGRADSICVAELCNTNDVLSPDSMHRHLEPATTAASGGMSARRRAALTPSRPLSVDALEARPQRLRRAGRIDPPGSRRVSYPLIEEAEPRSPDRRPVVRPATAVRLRMTAKALPARQAALAMTEALRQATIQQFDPIGTGRASVALFGKNDAGERVDTNHRHAHYLVMPAGGDPRGRLDTLVVWADLGFEEAEVEALAGITRLGGRQFLADFRPCRVAVEAVGSIEELVPELVGPASVWRSFTPYAPPRYIRRQATWHDHAEAFLRRDLAEAGKPPARIERSKGQWLSFRRHRPKERLADARRAAGFTLVFDEPVTGPISLGALRHLGLGLFVPSVQDDRTRTRLRQR